MYTLKLETKSTCKPDSKRQVLIAENAEIIAIFRCEGEEVIISSPQTLFRDRLSFTS